MSMFSGQFLALNLFSHVRRYSLSYKKYHNFPFLSPSFFFPFSFSFFLNFSSILFFTIRRQNGILHQFLNEFSCAWLIVVNYHHKHYCC